jgi:hypothetical protein
LHVRGIAILQRASERFLQVFQYGELVGHGRRIYPQKFNPAIFSVCPSLWSDA